MKFGPWTFKLKNAGNGFMIREHEPDVEYINIADVFMTNDPKIAERRALLMAAAPELCEMLREVMRSAWPNAKEHPTMFKAWQKANALLDRIEGD